MSGIGGICSPDGMASRGVLDSMLAALALPGESRGVCLGRSSVALGVAPRWPMQQVGSIDGLAMALNADLLNASHIEHELQKKGIQTAPLSHAQRLCWLYKIKGTSFVEDLDGAFSFALWDENEHRLVLGLDRLGIHSLYWCRRGDTLSFATRAGAVAAAELNPAAVMEFLLYSMVPAPHTIYTGVEKLRPGFLLIYEKGQVRQQNYWDLSYREDNARDVKSWATAVRDAMRSAVHRHMVDEDPNRLGAFLSGGTDSSSVVAFMHERHAPVSAFSICFQEAHYDEAGFAQTTANKFQARHFERSLSPQDAFDAIPKIIQYYDEPFANSSAVGSYYCARMAREAGVDTLLAGDGGDELFAGNERYAADKGFALYNTIPAALRHFLIEPIAGLLPRQDGFLSLPNRYIRRARIPNPRRIMSYHLFLEEPPEQVFAGDFLAQVPPPSWLYVAERHFHSAPAQSELNRVLYMDMKMTLADNDLRKILGTAELAGIQVRFPLLDHRLAELAGTIPTRLKLKGFEKRYIFKEAMKEILPHKVLYKKKHGFGVPMSSWFLSDQRLSAFMNDVLFDRRTLQRGYFRRDFLQNLRARHEEHPAYYGEILWYLMVLELWHRTHADARREVGIRV